MYLVGNTHMRAGRSKHSFVQPDRIPQYDVCSCAYDDPNITGCIRSRPKYSAPPDRAHACPDLEFRTICVLPDRVHSSAGSRHIKLPVKCRVKPTTSINRTYFGLYRAATTCCSVLLIIVAASTMPHPSNHISIMLSWRMQEPIDLCKSPRTQSPIYAKTPRGTNLPTERA